MAGRARVEVREFDKSQSVEGDPLFKVAIVGYAQKGPINVPTLVTNMQDFQDKFGSLSWGAAYERPNYLRNAARFYFDDSFGGNQAFIIRQNINAAADAFGSRDINKAGTGAISAGYTSASMSAGFGSGGANADAVLQDSDGLPAPTADPSTNSSVALRVWAKDKGDFSSGISIITYNKKFYDDAASGSNISAFYKVPGASEVPSSNDQFRLIVYDNFTEVESYFVSLLKGARNAKGENIYVEEIINGKSDYIWVDVPSSTSLVTIDASATVSSPSFSDFNTNASNGSLYYVGASGTSANANLTSGVYDVTSVEATSSVSAAYTAALSLTGNGIVTYDVNAIVAPGVSFDSTLSAYAKQVGSVASTRQDCVALVDIGRINAASAVAAKKASWDNNNYAVLYSNWFKYNDSFTGRELWLPPTIQALRNHARVWRYQDFFYAIAGGARGQLKNVNRLEYIYSDGELDYLADNQINALARLKYEGNCIWGQKTATNVKSDFQDLNIRYTFLYAEQAIARFARNLIFNFNNDTNRSWARNTIEGFLNDLQNRGAIEWFDVVCDTSNNTAQVIASNEFVVDIYIQATKVAEVIKLNFYASRNGLQVRTNG